MSELTRVQKIRIQTMLRCMVTEFERSLSLQAIGANPQVLQRARNDYQKARSEFDRLVELKGLRPGDRVRITNDGPFKGCEGIFTEVDQGAFLTVDWPEGSPCRDAPVTPLVEDIELVPWFPGMTE